MSNRLEAAVKAWDHHWGDRYGDEALEEMGEEVKVALDAADAVMFSPERVARIVQNTGLSLQSVAQVMRELSADV